jgi:hypothetical protein
VLCFVVAIEKQLMFADDSGDWYSSALWILQSVASWSNGDGRGDGTEHGFGNGNGAGCRASVWMQGDGGCECETIATDGYETMSDGVATIREFTILT